MFSFFFNSANAAIANGKKIKRELISNASDAADKLRFEAVTNNALYEGDSDLNIRLALIIKPRVTISDTALRRVSVLPAPAPKSRCGLPERVSGRKNKVINIMANLRVSREGAAYTAVHAETGKGMQKVGRYSIIQFCTLVLHHPSPPP